MTAISVPEAPRVRALALGAAAAVTASLCSLLLILPPHASRLADGSPVPAPHVMADGGPGPSSPNIPPPASAADGSPVPAPH